MQQMLVRSLGWEDPLKKEMATCPSILAWKIPSRGHKESNTTVHSTHTAGSCCCTVENNPTLQSNYILIFKKKKEHFYGESIGFLFPSKLKILLFMLISTVTTVLTLFYLIAKNKQSLVSVRQSISVLVM